MSADLKKEREESLKRMLRPFVRYCLRGSDTIQYIIKLLKVVYVEIAVEELERAGEKVNMSRLNVMTGVQRADIAKIYKKKEPLKPIIGDIVTRVIGQWTQDQRFCTKDGKPKVLSFAGKNSEFEQLVGLVTTSVGPAAVLFELERADAVEKSKTGLKLTRTTMKFGKNRVRATAMLGQSVEVLMTASHENGEADLDEAPHLHIRTEYDNVFVKDLPKIRQWLKKEGRKFHKRARDYISKFDKDISDKLEEKAGGKVVLGAFSYVSGEEPDDGISLNQVEMHEDSQEI
ncbi:MAG: hypothetical protein KDD66_02075 [Bdellovibrionales bacterium]|nr:hypothetical protein [Bdellovibrionales bacterium]